MRAGILLLAAMLALPPLAAEGQESSQGAQDQRVPTVTAGDVATLVIKVPATEDAETATYRVDVGPRFRAFVPPRGEVSARQGLFVIPLTLATPAGLPAGRLSAGTIEIELGRQTLVRELWIDVRSQRSVRFFLDVEELTVPVDGTTAVPIRLVNRGNVPDTIQLDARLPEGWTLVSVVSEIIQPGDTLVESVRIAAPPTVSPGDQVLVALYARTTEQELTQTARLVVVPADAWLGDLAHVPSSVFVGQTLGTGAGPVLALSGSGRVGPETEVRVDLRHVNGLVDPALQRRIAGPRLRASVDRPGLSVEAGDVYGFRNILSGSLRRAVGAQASFAPEGPLFMRGTAALPTAINGHIGDGHILYGEFGYETGLGRTSLLAGDLIFPSRGTASRTRSSGAGVRWEQDFGSHGGSVEATGVRFAAGDSTVEAGPAVDVAYALNMETISGRFRLRRTPSAVATHSGQGNEISGSVTARVAPGFYLVAWGYDVEQKLLASGTNATSRTADLALRARLGQLQLQTGANLLERATESGGVTFASRRRTVTMSATYTRGMFSFRPTAEIGRADEFGTEGPYRSFGASARMRRGDRWGWLHLLFSQRPGGIQTTNLNGGGEILLGPAEISGGFSWSRTGDLSFTSVWVGSGIQAFRNLSIHVGASARPGAGSEELRFSLGVSRRLNLPLPIRRQPDLEGVVFDDLNGNGVREPEEPPVGGVTLDLGHLHTVTAPDGRFSFREAPGSPLRVRTERLPHGYAVSPEVSLPRRGTAVVPLVRTALLTLDTFLDRDNDGRRDPAETPGAGVSVTVTDEAGRQRTVTADEDGRAVLSGLAPGRYSITARPPSPRRSGADAEVLLELELAPGEEASVTLPVPLRQRTIRMDGGSGL